MAKFFVTYGFGTNLAHCYSEIEAEDHAKAREIVDEVTKGKFAFFYSEENFEGQVERYALHKVDLQPQVKDHE